MKDLYCQQNLLRRLLTVISSLCVTIAGAQHIPFKYLTVEDGLSQNSVVSIAQDSLGFMWFATRNGLSRYDGYSVQIFESNAEDSLTLTSNSVNSLEVESGTTLWIGTSRGLSKWDRRTGQITRMNAAFENDDLNGLYNIGDILVDSRGDVWVMASAGGFHIFQRKAGETMFRKRLMLNDPPGQVEGFYGQFMEDKEGNIWIGTSRRGIWQYDCASDTFAQLPSTPPWENLAVTCLISDRAGSIWVGTLTGLYKWIVSEQKMVAVAGMEGIMIRSLYYDRGGRFWVGTDSEGLALYHESSGHFTFYDEQSGQGDALLHNSIQAIYEDRQGILWVGTYAGGVNYYDPHPGVFHNYQAVGPAVLRSNIISGFAEEPDGDVWIATDRGGLARFDRRRNSFDHFQHHAGQPYSLSTNIIQHISVTRNGQLLVGTWQNGLDRFDPVSGRFYHSTYRPGDSTSLPDNSVNFTLEDSRGLLWTGCTRGLSVSRKRFDAYAPGSPLTFHTFTKTLDAASLSNNYVNAIYEDTRGAIWIATWAGLNQWNPETRSFFNFENNPENRAVFTAHHIRCLNEDHENLLIGTNESGLFIYDASTNKLRNFTKRDGLPSNTVVGIERGTNDDWWISTSNGLARFNMKTQTFVSYNRYDGLPSNEFRSNAHARLQTGELLFGGNNGFTRFHPDSVKTNRYAPIVSFTGFRLFNQIVKPGPKSVLAEDVSLTRQITLAAHQSSFGIDFVGINFTASQKNTYAYKMEGIDEEWTFVGSQHSANYSYLPAGTYRFYVKSANSDGIWSEPVALAITINPHWWTTGWFRALAVMVALTGIWLVFKLRTRQLVERKRILEQTVKERTLELEGKNYMLSNAKEALEMQTLEIQRQRDNIEDQLRTIQALNEIGQKITAYLKKDELIVSIHCIINTFMDAPHLSIGYLSGDHQTIHFATIRDMDSTIEEISLSMEETDRLSVASITGNVIYTLGDIPNEVETVLPRHAARYLVPGSYRSAIYIPLKSMNGSVTQILIVKNFQKTGFSPIHVDILKSLGAYIAIAYENAEVYKALKVQSELLAKKSEQLKELHEIKSRFFINMSHEFRTPLTLIISPLEQLLETGEAPDWTYVQHHLEIMNKNARQLLTMINRLLEMRNAVVKTDKPVLVNMDIVSFLRNIMMQFEHLAERHAIHYRIITSALPVFTQIDGEMMEKVFVNLYSNAFKYTPRGGSITTTLAVTQGEKPCIEIQIADTGKGISEKDLPFIFDRFYQGDDPVHTIQEGSGLGLSLVKDFIELHGGVVSVTSEVNKGSLFSVIIPCIPDALEESQENNATVEDAPNDDQPDNKLLPLVLLIDDSPDVLEFLGLSLDKEFRILRTENGKTGYELAIQHIPDVIVSDVMMPVMDGLELCKHVKADPRTSHIPIILLTAKTAENAQVAGLDVGADDYLSKPFKVKLLRARIHNLIATRRKLHELFSLHRNFEISELISNEHDKGFIERLDDILKENIRNTALNQELLTREIGMSKTQLYRKLKALTGKTVHEYIRNYRLRVAHEIIRQSDMRIYEVAYEVGFSDPAYFSNSFNAYFGFWPKDLKKG